MYFRKNDYNDKVLVFYSPGVDLAGEVWYFKEDPLITNFLEGQVPIGILLDYIEDNNLIFYTTSWRAFPIDSIRTNFTEITQLFNPNTNRLYSDNYYIFLTRA